MKIAIGKPKIGRYEKVLLYTIAGIDFPYWKRSRDLETVKIRFQNLWRIIYFCSSLYFYSLFFLFV